MSENAGDFFIIEGTDFKERVNKDDRRVAKKESSSEKPLGETTAECLPLLQAVDAHPDLAAAWAATLHTPTPELAAPDIAAPAPVAGTSMRRWAHALVTEAHRPERSTELDFWRGILADGDRLLGDRPLDPDIDTAATVRTVSTDLPVPVTEALLTTVPTAFHGTVDDALLTALALAVTGWRSDRGGGTSDGQALQKRATVVVGARVRWVQWVDPHASSSGSADPEAHV